MHYKNNNYIAITAIIVGDKPDNFVHTISDMKKVKELFMDLKMSAKFEKEIYHLAQDLTETECGSSDV